MTYAYQIHPLVEQDFEEGYIWYEERQKGLGERFINAVDAKIKQILLMSTIFMQYSVRISGREKQKLFDCFENRSGNNNPLTSTRKFKREALY